MPNKTKKKFLFELRRKILHVVLGTLVIFSIIINFPVKWILFYMLLAGFIISMILLYWKIPLIWKTLSFFERPVYLKRFPGKGLLFFFSGCLFVLKLFPQNIALASIAILTFGDPISNIFGLFGKIKHKKPFNKLKNIEGSIAGIIAGTIASSFFVGFLNAFIASFGAMLAEAISFKLGIENVDDNIIVPLVAGTILYLL